MMQQLLFLLLLAAVKAGKILVYSPSISHSHLISNGRIADTLVKAGHDVVMFIPEYVKATSNFDGAKLAKIVRMNDISPKYEEDMDFWGDRLMTQPNLGFAERIFCEYSNQHMCEKLMARREELEFLKNYGFDAAFAEQIDFCGIGVIRQGILEFRISYGSRLHRLWML
ncbi:unnamed protein product [Strongylus vulgaris]|uniref:glucuronosyltransferase n=1 Tax=Strongylus vulgaris TaxID=40348 RepID=A0A3P7LHW9_STRVU|nr:unnamed protein product [Strongylus vulgaris]